MNTIDKFNEHIMGTYNRFEVVMERGFGRSAYDETGREYVDFGSGIGANSLGYSDKEWADAVCEQVRTIQHTSNYYYTKVQADFASELCAASGYSKAFFCNSGAEANECAIKMARKYSFDKYGAESKRYNIITLLNSFHGRTITTLAATGQEVFHNYFFPFTEGFINVKANDIDDLRNRIDDSVCAVMFEFIQGEGGVVPLDQEFVDEIFKICEANDILTIADEVQTGVGRTGKFLAAEYYSVKPDITTLAKGLAGGIPVGACLANEKCAGILTPGTHASTFGGNPIACAGGLAVLSKAGDAGFLGQVRKKSDYIRSELIKIPEVEDTDGIGLMIGIRLRTKNAADVCRAAADAGLLVLTAKNKLRLLPPLNITFAEIDKGLEILKGLLI